MRKLVEKTRKLSCRVIVIVIMGLFSIVCLAQPAAPNVSVEIITIDDVDYVRISWEAAEGAQSYNIYSSTDADTLNWVVIAAVEDTVYVYNVPVSDERVRLFYVTASDEAPVPPGMVFVQGGTFNPTDDYTVTLSSFYIGKYEVTQSKWTSVMGGIYDPDWTDRGQGPNHPAYNISWFDAVEYCNRLSIREGLTPCYSYTVRETEYGTNPDNWPEGWNSRYQNHSNVSCNWTADGYRLPTEMEREFAARGGVPAQNADTFNGRWAGTNVEAELVNYAWYSANSNMRTHPVGTKLPNELGLYDMSGNVFNWVWDKHGDYPTGVHNNPTGSTTGITRVQRGGAWMGGDLDCNVAHRSSGHATSRFITNGFRVSRRIP